MARRCTLTGRRTRTGNNVSHSNRHTKRKFKPNIQKKRIYIPELDKWVTLKLSTRALRTITKMGAYQYLRKVEKTRGVKIL